MVHKGIFITATDTGVGKTYVTAGLAAAIRRKLCELQPNAIVKLWKPVQSGTETGSPQADSYRLMMGSGLPQTETEIVSHTFTEPLAPWMAALREGAKIDFAVLAQEGLRRKEAADFLLVEGAGGLLVPLTENHLIADLAAALELPIVIVARPGLGTVNHTLLTIRAAQGMGLRIAGVILNGCKDTGAKWLLENIRMIERFGGVPVLGKLPWFAPEPGPNEAALEAAEWQGWREQWAAILERELRWDYMMQDH